MLFYLQTLDVLTPASTRHHPCLDRNHLPTRVLTLSCLLPFRIGHISFSHERKSSSCEVSVYSPLRIFSIIFWISFDLWINEKQNLLWKVNLISGILLMNLVIFRTYSCHILGVFSEAEIAAPKGEKSGSGNILFLRLRLITGYTVK